MRQRSNLIILFGIAFFLVGGAIVFLVLNDDDDDGGSSGAQGVGEVSVLIATDDIPANTLGSDVLEQGLLTTKLVPAGSAPVGAITSTVALDNQIFTVGVAKGDTIVQAQLAVRSLSNIQIPEGYDGVAVTIDYTPGGAGYIAPGDVVNIYGVYGDSSVTDAGLLPANAESPVPLPRTELALTNVLVLDVSSQQGTSAQASSSTESANQQQTVGRQTSGTPLTYLLAVRTTDAERIVQLTSFAQIYLSLTADDAPPAGDTPGVAGDNVNGPVSANSAAPQS